MKIFTESEGSFKNKVNFVDENNVFVGYDTAQCCCESADWFFSKNYDTTLKFECDKFDKKFENKFMVQLSEEELKDFVFDKSYRDSFSFEYGGGGEIFKLVNTKNDKEYYLTIYNCHNGYYSHGFDFGVGETIIESGSI